MYYLVVILFAVAWIMLSIVRNYVETKSPINSVEECWGTTLIWVNYTLSKFGELLKLQIPSYNLKVVDGWSNSSGTVTSLGICESKKDNRESKSVLCESNTVKEQRLYGSGQVLYSDTCLRYTLIKGFEINSKIYNHSNLMSNKFFSTSG